MNVLFFMLILLPDLSIQVLKSSSNNNLRISLLQTSDNQEKEKPKQNNEKTEEQIIMEIKDPKNIFYATGKCNLSNCANCVSQNVCQCPYGYAHDPNKKVVDNEQSCQYKLKKQTLFFFLEMIFPIGIGHFYVRRLIHGIVKICLAVGIVALDFIIKRILKTYKSKQSFNIFIYILYFAYVLFVLVDLICIGINYYHDGKGFVILTMKEE